MFLRSQNQNENERPFRAIINVGSIRAIDSTIAWYINNFPAIHSSLKISEKVRSPRFGVNGRIWRLELYPRGADIRHAQFATIILRNLANVDVQAMCNIAIVNELKMEAVSVTMNSRLYTRTFNDEVMWDRGDFVTQDILMNPVHGLVVNGLMTITCTITETE